jgi:hypothetical protein
MNINDPDFGNIVALKKYDPRYDDDFPGDKVIEPLSLLRRQSRSPEAYALTATPMEWCDITTIEPRDWIYGRHYIRGFATASVAPSKLGKSPLVMAEAVAMVTGRALLNENIRRQVRVWYWNGEDPYKELKLRFAAIFKHYQISNDDLGNRLFVDSGRDKRIVIASTTRNGTIVNEPVVDAIFAEIKAKNVDVLIIDPFISCHEVPENDNPAIDRVVKQWAYIADVCNMSVELVHHVRKPSGGRGETTVDDARGGSSFVGAVRSCRVLNTMSKEEATVAGVDPNTRRRHFRIDVSSNMFAPVEAATWRKIVSIDADNAVGDKPSDSVGVVTSWICPDALEGVTAKDLWNIQKRVSEGRWRKDSRSSHWVGNAVADALRLDIRQEQVKTRVKKMLTTWIANKMFKVVVDLDEQRHEREFVEVDQWAT